MSFRSKFATSLLWIFILFLFPRSDSIASIVSLDTQPNPKNVPKKIIVTYKSTPSSLALRATAESMGSGARFMGSLGRSSDTRVFSVTDVNQALVSARSDPNVSSARVDPIFTITKTANDEYFPVQWNLKKLGVAGKRITAWDLIPTPIADKTSTVKVAVIDTGVDKTHPELVGKIDASENDWVNCFKGPNDSSSSCIPNQGNDVDGHGTHVAGTIAAVTNNSKGIAGAGWGVKIMSVRVLNEDGVGTLSDVIRGINWAVDHGAKVLNMSLGGYESDLTAQDKTDLQNAINYAWETRGAVVVAAAGNCGGGVSSGGDGCKRYDDRGNVIKEIVNEKSYPAVLPNVISVGALTKSNSLASYSEFGADKVDVLAPGGDGNCGSGSTTCILSLYPAAKATPIVGTPTPAFYIANAAGTSMATPHVSAVAALLLSANDQLTNRQVVDAIQNHADTSLSGSGTKWQYGVVDACKSVYTVVNDGATPVPGVVCGASGSGDDVLATPTPFPSRNLCAKKCKEFVSNYSGRERGKGDANCSGKVTKKDFNVLINQYDTVPVRDKKNNANIQCIAKKGGNPATFLVNLADFEVWRRNTKDLGQIGELGLDDGDEEGD